MFISIQCQNEIYTYKFYTTFDTEGNISKF